MSWLALVVTAMAVITFLVVTWHLMVEATTRNLNNRRQDEKAAKKLEDAESEVVRLRRELRYLQYESDSQLFTMTSELAHARKGESMASAVAILLQEILSIGVDFVEFQEGIPLVLNKLLGKTWLLECQDLKERVFFEAAPRPGIEREKLRAIGYEIDDLGKLTYYVSSAPDGETETYLTSLANAIFMLSSLGEKAVLDNKGTGLLNDLYFRKRVAVELDRSFRHNHPYSLVYLDLDHYRDFNERYGHLAVDKATISIATALKGNLRPSDDSGRHGGDEMMFGLAETDIGQAEKTANHILTVLANTSLFDLGGESLTASIGVVSFTKRYRRRWARLVALKGRKAEWERKFLASHDILVRKVREKYETEQARWNQQIEARENSIVSALLKEADDLTIIAKKEGRNRVIVSQEALKEYQAACRAAQKRSSAC